MATCLACRCRDWPPPAGFKPRLRKSEIRHPKSSFGRIERMRTILGLLATLLSLAPGDALCASRPVHARRAMVVTVEPHATDIGVDVLKTGGNAIDAAVAVAFALAVTHPSAGNLGGGGFLLARFADGRTTFLDFRERAPASASRDMYLEASGNPTRVTPPGSRPSVVPAPAARLAFPPRHYVRKPH